jgi:hypothetical protein
MSGFLRNFPATRRGPVNKPQERVIERLAAPVPGMGKLTPVGPELGSKTAMIGTPSYLASATARDTSGESKIKRKSGGCHKTEKPPKEQGRDPRPEEKKRRPGGEKPREARENGPPKREKREKETGKENQSGSTPPSHPK